MKGKGNLKLVHLISNIWLKISNSFPITFEFVLGEKMTLFGTFNYE